jgi:hypothetical protein
MTPGEVSNQRADLNLNTDSSHAKTFPYQPVTCTTINRYSMLSKHCQASLTHLGHSLVHNPIKPAQERPLKEQHTLPPHPNQTWELKKQYLQKQDQATCFPSLGECLKLSLVYLHTPHFYLFMFHFYSTIPSP